MSFPCGVYWAGETAFQTDPAQRQLIASELAALRKLNVNTIWITHLSAVETGNFATQCAPFGIRIVASPSALDIRGEGDVQGHKRNQNYYREQIPKTLRGYGQGNPKPLFWCLGDEPTASNIPAYREYVAIWRELAPAEKIGVVVDRNRVPEYSTLGLDYVCHFTYPFRPPGVPGDDDGEIGSWMNVCANNVALNHGKAWSMLQAFSKPAEWREPTAAEVRWQIYSAVALGARGVIAFSWAPERTAEGLTTLREWPIQQQSLSAAYKSVQNWRPIVIQREIVKTETLPGPPGSFCTTFKPLSESLQGFFVIVVCGPAEGATFDVPVDSGKKAIENLGFQGRAKRVSDGKFQVQLAAGDAKCFMVW